MQQIVKIEKQILRKRSRVEVTSEHIAARPMSHSRAICTAATTIVTTSTEGTANAKIHSGASTAPITCGARSAPLTTVIALSNSPRLTLVEKKRP